MPPRSKSPTKKTVKKKKAQAEAADCSKVTTVEEELSGENGEVKVKYNHYNEFFQVVKGAISWADIDDAYAISFVFQGEFKRKLLDPEGQRLSERAGSFHGARLDVQYELIVEEDEEAGVGNRELGCGYQVSTAVGAAPGSSSRSNELTQQLKGLSTEDLRAQTDEYKQLKEARDLEDVLYSA
ncbi:hypothetical protein CYMTET_43382 [Cymbomonas tetramitiformis]|uniref:Uncharacterized protein n=1 Tax=Cymbomonas tetramitiformis TaxID=36881 RepID=A0AAE0ELS5_9CHLO|nr:hypothetical protein CYMTET_56630 [Cymbomonas tetramitiformis]KAK3247110.1 hypothetical protein CYMTET_43382 [Cymbomonas tetramitiformis]